MENPPDLIVATTLDDQCQDKKKIIVENICQQHDDIIANLRSEKYLLQCEIQQLRTQLLVRNNTNNTINNEFDEQAHLLQQRFHDEIQSVIYHHTELVQHVTNDLSNYVTQILKKSIENIESLRLLHQKELCTHSTNLTDCIQHQSCEMNELCNHLIVQQRTKPMDLFNTVTNNFQSAVNNLKTSFDSKINYLNDIHVSKIEKLNTKHEIELDEMKCELNLMYKQ
ncbi:unnamed protein product [Adineta steineri]|uniref:Uncharacterized protein n=1 Tax=Adineta steineri TaxID=433720 RepID=A0A819SBV7_9BILA|nr:unnamed protein product [Adineta steineri]CAF4049988.1 unnamed protein product [Adineta steineri]